MVARLIGARADHLSEVHTLSDGRAFIAAQTVAEWPDALRDWIARCNAWRPAHEVGRADLDGYVYAVPEDDAA